MKFYQNQGVLDELVSKAPKCFEESVILTNEEHQSVLNGWLSLQVPEMASKLERFTQNVTPKGPLTPSWRAEITFLVDSLKCRESVCMLVVTGLDNGVICCGSNVAANYCFHGCDFLTLVMETWDFTGANYSKLTSLLAFLLSSYNTFLLICTNFLCVYFNLIVDGT